MTAASVAQERRRPRRTCVACRTERDKRDLVRIVRRPDREVVLDASGRAPGRGAYLCADAACFSLALKRSAVERALGATLPPQVIEHLTTVSTGPVSEAAHGT